MNKILLNIFVLFIGICAGLITYYYSFQNVLIDKCLLNSKDCVRIRYKLLKNTALIELPNSYWVWFNGGEFLTYGYPSDMECQEGYDVAFIINSEDLVLKGFQCAKSLDSLIEMYKDVGYKYYFISTRPCKNERNPAKCQTHVGCDLNPKYPVQGNDKTCLVVPFGAVDVINMLLKEGIIHKTHIISKNYKQPNPHTPTSPSAAKSPTVTPIPTPGSCPRT
jgi:hypothetical protein